MRGNRSAPSVLPLSPLPAPASASPSPLSPPWLLLLLLLLRQSFAAAAAAVGLAAGRTACSSHPGNTTKVPGVGGTDAYSQVPSEPGSPGTARPVIGRLVSLPPVLVSEPPSKDETATSSAVSSAAEHVPPLLVDSLGFKQVPPGTARSLWCSCARRRIDIGTSVGTCRLNGTHQLHTSCARAHKQASKQAYAALMRQ
jgi:hypothetical protein